MALTSSVYCVVLLLVGVISACQPPDCDNPDCGTCSNACCTLEFKFARSAETVYNDMVAYLKSGGNDKHYKFVNGSDLRPYKIKSGVEFMIQAIHTTKVHHYNDTLDFLLSSNPPGSKDETLVQGFSISQIYGAYCDDGQNYKNLVGYVKGLGLDFAQRTISGCKGQ